MTTPNDKRFLLVSFDGLRPDLISERLTPNIRRIADRGVVLDRHVTTYPSETRVGFPSLVTGASPARHGLIGNKYLDRDVSPPLYVDTADAGLVARLALDHDRPLLGATSLGEVLADAGKSLAVLSTNFPGTVRLFHHRAESYGHARLSGHHADVCTPPALLDAVTARLGPLPAQTPRGTADLAAQEYLVSAFLDIIWPEHRPDVTIIGFGEPDVISHFTGTGSAATYDAIRFCDAQLGRLVDWWEQEGAAAGFQIALLSDHGHITGHSRCSIGQTLSDLGFAPGAAPGPGIDAVVVPGQVGAIYLSDPSPAALDRLVDGFSRQPWCGNMFTAPVRPGDMEGRIAGTLSSALVFADHVRSPDLFFCYRTDDGVDPFGLVGGTWYDNDRPAGLGLHGGLHAKELTAVGILAGDVFKLGVVSSVPTSIADLMPTILSAMGIASPASVTGRAIEEAFLGKDGALPAETETVAAGRGGYRQYLERVRAGGLVYLVRGWAESK